MINSRNHLTDGCQIVLKLPSHGTLRLHRNSFPSYSYPDLVQVGATAESIERGHANIVSPIDVNTSADDIPAALEALSA
jgi:hypothetical protein